MKKALLTCLSLIKGPFQLTFFLFFIIMAISGEATAQKYYTAEKSFVIKLGTTRPLYESIPIGPTDSLKLKERDANKPEFVPNFAGGRPLEYTNPNSLQVGPDRLFH